ncbi:MAG: hypothetical protein V1787_00350 [Candidatus Micrarchaeota archaeon]
MPEKTGEMGAGAQTPAEEWLRTIRENPGKFPMLHNYVYINELHADRGRKESDWQRESGKIYAELLVGGVLGYFAAKRLTMTQGRMTRRKFFQNIGTGGGLIAAGRTADIFSTRRGLQRFDESLREIRDSNSFRGLPEEVQRRILPKAEAIESNPDQDTDIGRIREPARAFGRIAGETVGPVAISATAAGLMRATQEILRRLDSVVLKKTPGARKPIGRRVFLGLTGSATAIFFYVAQSNLRLGNFISEHPRIVKAELEELHKMMEEAR